MKNKYKQQQKKKNQKQNKKKRIPIRCKVPVNFDFEFVSVQKSECINIDPKKGVILGNSYIDIELFFCPFEPINYQAIYELKTSQYEFEHIKVTITGQGVLQRNLRSTIQVIEKKQNEVIEEEEGNQNQILKKRQKQKRITMINNLIEEIPQQQQLTQYKQQQNTKQKLQYINNPTQQQINISNLLLQKQIDPGRHSKEKYFLAVFNNVNQLDQQKQTRFFQCIGDKQIQEDTIYEVRNQRVEFQNKKFKMLEFQGINRFEVQFDKDAPIIEQIVPNFDCKWDFSKNDPQKRKKIITKRMLYAISKVILRMRLEENLQAIKNLIQQIKNKHEQELKNLSKEKHGAYLRECVQKLVNEDWQKAEYTNLNKKNLPKCELEFEFEEHNITRTFYPIQYENSNNFSNFKYEVNPRTGFDDYALIENICQCDSEVMGYRNWEVPPIIHYPPVEEQRAYRTCCEEEYSFRGKTGTQRKLEKEKVQIMPKSFIWKLDMPSHILNCEQEGIRQYQEIESVTEINPSYYLYPEQLSTQDELDPIEKEKNEIIIQHEFLSKLPGLNSGNILAFLPIERNYYYLNRLELPFDCGNVQNVGKYCTGVKNKPDYEDFINDEEKEILQNLKYTTSAAQKYDVSKGDNFQTFIKCLEEDDEDFSKFKQSQLEDVRDELKETEKKIVNGLRIEKIKWIATLPSKTSEYNRFINENSNRLCIL
ncbi:hypothetical protein IMG5_102000 [Ichthyophthirius multifiliis]|uniref:Uncharacterized protein n=1 Tax=Ichthyophthirius multifiliis TaxID=5932 RepID=G0QSL1_ICHMU|nr:hypothetical protein IMG5_102000 [Ichthyophthirius multifiliis]EGR31791.1 hypothetical protein IMG5_102000 [Ichthyophthirius multifiliis]|eukprot:XP_004035277.1 hypothetical protein IMG5_102000 [Ichthyophthirius multifiliis]